MSANTLLATFNILVKLRILPKKTFCLEPQSVLKIVLLIIESKESIYTHGIHVIIRKTLYNIPFKIADDLTIPSILPT